MRPGTVALVFAAALSVGFVVYDLSGLSHKVATAAVADVVAADAPAPSEGQAVASESVQQQVNEILAQRSRNSSNMAQPPSGTLTPGVPRTDSPAEFAEIRENQYREMIRLRTENTGEGRHDSVPVEELLRMKERGVIVQ